MSHRRVRLIAPALTALVAAATVLLIALGAPGLSGTAGALNRATPASHPGRAVRGSGHATRATRATRGSGRAVRGSGRPGFILLDQTPWVRPSSPGAPATFSLDLSAVPGTPGTDEVVVTLYQMLHTRSGFEQTLKATPSSRVLDQTHPVPLSALPAAPAGSGVPAGSTLAVSVLPDPTAASSVPATTPTLDLDCLATGPGSCTGVYPVTVDLLRPSTGGRASLVEGSSFTTYLTYAAAKSRTPLDFGWVVPVSAPVSIRTTSRNPATAVRPLSATEAAALEGLATTLSTHPGVPVTVAASPQTLQSLIAAGGRGPQAVQELASMSVSDQSNRQFVGEPYVPINLGALAGGGEGGEIAAQTKLGQALDHSFGIETPDRYRTWVATGTVGTDLRLGMSQPSVAASRVVIPDADLAPPRDNEGTWASAFTISLGRGAPVTAAASDGELAAHFTADPDDPALEATQLLADLAMIHFEAPNTPVPRGVVAVPPSGWTPNRAFDSEVLAGLTTSPIVHGTTLNSYFSAFSAVLASTPPTRRLADGGTGPVLALTIARRVTEARLRLTYFAGSVVGNPPVKAELDELLLDAESDDLQPSAQLAGVHTVEGVLTAQLSQVQLATARSITLTARTGLVPVTIESSAPYTVVGLLQLTGDRFIFPHGSTRPMTLDHATNPVRIDVEARTSGDLPLTVTFLSPTGKLRIASGRLTVRSTATSVVAIVLTVLALLVLIGWWLLTWRDSRRKKRRRRQGGRGGPTVRAPEPGTAGVVGQAGALSPALPDR